MKAKKTSQKGSRAPLLVAVLSMAVLGGLAAYIANSPGLKVPRVESSRQDKGPAPNVKVYTPAYKEGDLSLSHKTVPVESGQDAHVVAVNKYLEQLKMVPKDARAVSCKVEDGIATVDFTASFETTYGTEDEQTVLKGVLTALGQFSEIKEVRFTVLGRTLESIGNVDLTTPQPVLRDAGGGH